MLFYTHLLLLLQPLVLWLSVVTFNSDAKPPLKWILRVFDVSWIRPQLGGLPHLETFTWQNLTRSGRVTWSGRPGQPPCQVTPITYHVNVIKLKWPTWGLPPPCKQALIILLIFVVYSCFLMPRKVKNSFIVNFKWCKISLFQLLEI